MEKSSSLKNIAAALISFHEKVDKIPKDAKNPFFKSTYASLSNILESIKKPLIESGLTVCQFPSGDHGLDTIIIHAESGEFLQSDYIMKPAKDDPQGIGSAITYQRRYALAAALGLNIDDDDDGNAASKNGHEAVSTTKIDDKPWLNEGTDQYKAAITKLKSGATTIDKIKLVMKVSKATETKLLEAIKS
jgi:hypothetical protein